MNSQSPDIEIFDVVWGPLLGDGPYPALIAEVINATNLFVHHALERIAPIVNDHCDILVRFTESAGYVPTLHVVNQDLCLVYVPIGFVIRIIGFTSLILQYENDGPTIQLLVSPINRPETEVLPVPSTLSFLVGEAVNDWRGLWRQTEAALHTPVDTVLNTVIEIKPMEHVYMDALLLSTIACSFAVFHEVAHALECHLTAKQWIIRNIEPKDAKISMFLKGMEVRADIAATTYMLALLDGLHGIESRTQSRSFITALSALFASLDVNRRAFRDYDDGDYFPPTIRLACCLNHVRDALDEPLIEEWENLCRDTILFATSSLDYLAVCHGAEHPIHAINLPLSNSPAFSVFVELMQAQSRFLEFAEYFLGIENRGPIKNG